MKKLVLADRTLQTDKAAFVMGIVNVTPDSFYAESRAGAGCRAIDYALRLIDEGADILDIGGESTRPGSDYVDAEEEIRRVVPLVQEIRKHNRTVAISVDTRKSAVMQAALDAGADILNDVSALEDDEALFPLCARSGIPVILMHKRGIPQNMQANTAYRDVFSEVDEYLAARAELAVSRGIAADKIIVDPGIGFGKDAAGNSTLILHCGELCKGRYPVLMALSRKTVIGALLQRGSSPVPPEERLFGTVAADILAVQGGASLIRVHDVKPAVDTMTLLEKISILDGGLAKA
ncbi:MAG: dihydropteroate synthase [Treponema sp.]|nr:dihydropteroate synthase [Treponema sp.]